MVIEGIQADPKTLVGAPVMVGGNADVTMYDKNAVCKSTGYVHVVGVWSLEGLMTAGKTSVICKGPILKGQSVYAQWGGYCSPNQQADLKRKTLVGTALHDCGPGDTIAECILKL